MRLVKIEVAESQEPSSERSTSGSKPTEETPRELGREEFIARGGVVRAAWCGRVLVSEPEAPKVARPAPVLSPVQGAVDRSAPLDVFSIDTEIKVREKILVVLRRPYGHPSGPLPGDPGRFSSRVDPRLGVCHVLSAAAAVRCLRGDRYF